MSNAVTGTGILIKRAPLANPTAFVTVGEITEVDPGGKSRNKIETSTHNEETESHVLGILRQSDPTFKINYVASDATHVVLNSDIDNNVKAVWQVLFKSGRIRQGEGYLQNFKFHVIPVDGKQGADLAFVWAGPVTEL
jgi:hypothetical protein